MTGKALSWKEFTDLMNKIEKDHRFGYGGRNIKYIDPILDMRTRDIFHVKYRGMFKDGEIVFDFRDSDESLYERISKWLDEKTK